jgi:hypothetical protein
MGGECDDIGSIDIYTYVSQHMICTYLCAIVQCEYLGFCYVNKGVTSYGFCGAIFKKNVHDVGGLSSKVDEEKTFAGRSAIMLFACRHLTRRTYMVVVKKIEERNRYLLY